MKSLENMSISAAFLVYQHKGEVVTLDRPICDRGLRGWSPKLMLFEPAHVPWLAGAAVHQRSCTLA